MKLNVRMQIIRTPQVLIFKMKLIHITGVIRTAPNNGIHGTFTMCSVTL